MSEQTLGFSAARLMRNTAARTVGSIATLLAGGATGLIVARHLGPQGYGSFAFVWSIAWAVATLVPLGFESLLVRELNREPRLLDLRRVLPAVVAAGSVAALGMAAAALFASDRSLGLALAAAGLYVLASGPRALLRAVFDAEERMGLTAATDVGEALVSLALVVALVLSDAGLLALSVAIVGARFVALAIATAMLRRWVPRTGSAAPQRPLRTLLRSSLPMAGSRIANELLRRADVLILGLVVVPDRVGWYVAAATIALYAPVGLMELNRALFPVISRAESPEDHDLMHLFGLTWRAHLLLGTVAAAGLAVLAHPIITLLYGEAYAPAAPLLAVLAVTIPLRLGGALCAVTLDATYRQTRHLRAAGTALLLNLALNVVLIPLLGAWGAVIAGVAAEVVFLAAALRALRPHRPRVLQSVLWSLLAGAPVATAAALTPGSLLLRILAGGMIFGLMAAGFVWRRRATATDHVGLGSIVRGARDPGQGGPP